jgi:hypothetical protein
MEGATSTGSLSAALTRSLVLAGYIARDLFAAAYRWAVWF